MTLTRKEFLGSVVTAAAGAAGAALLVACGGDGGSADAAPRSCIMNGTTTDIAGNHGHVMTVSKAEIAAGTAKTYDIKGSADHSHNVTISAAFFTQLTSNTTVMTVSTGAVGDGHTHSITVVCV